MLSILIPTYNYNIFSLVQELYDQAELLNINFEIIVLDDGSTKFVEENSKINSLDNCFFKVNSENFGRSKTRNLLAKNATYNWLLFLDADTFPKNNQFLANYLQHIDDNFDAINGGIVYQKESPEKNQLLRWKYGIEREALSAEKRNDNPYLSFLTLNFLIRKDVFNDVSFNEDIPNLRHEDTLFSYELKKKNIQINHIDNPVIHNGLDTSELFLKKSREAVQNLRYLNDHNLIASDYVKLLKLSNSIKALGLKSLFAQLHKIFSKKLEKNLLSQKPSMYLFDFYRVTYLSSL